MNPVLVDTHCHVHLDSEAALALNDAEHDAEDIDGKVRVRTVAMGIRQADWPVAIEFGESLQRLQRRSDPSASEAAERHDVQKEEPSTPSSAATGANPPPYYTFGLGLHPWHVHQASPDWLESLRSELQRHPRALLGEAGLDRAARCPDTGRVRVDWPGQREAFAQQFRLAAALNRPMSVHCVRAHGTLLDMLDHTADGHDDGAAAAAAAAAASAAEFASAATAAIETAETASESGLAGGALAAGGSTLHPDPLGLPPRIALHSYSGSADMVRQLCALPRGVGGRVFFGFSASVNLKTEVMESRMRAALEHVPSSRLLVESDSADSDAVLPGLLRVCRAVAAAKDMNLHEVAALAARNAELFLARVPK